MKMNKWVEVKNGKVVAVRTNTLSAPTPTGWREVTDKVEEIGPGSVHNKQADTYGPPTEEVPAADSPSLNEQITTLTAQVTALQASIQTLLDR